MLEFALGAGGGEEGGGGRGGKGEGQAVAARCEVGGEGDGDGGGGGELGGLGEGGGEVGGVAEEDAELGVVDGVAGAGEFAGEEGSGHGECDGDDSEEGDGVDGGEGAAREGRDAHGAPPAARRASSGVRVRVPRLEVSWMCGEVSEKVPAGATAGQERGGAVGLVRVADPSGARVQSILPEGVSRVRVVGERVWAEADQTSTWRVDVKPSIWTRRLARAGASRMRRSVATVVQPATAAKMMMSAMAISASRRRKPRRRGERFMV